MSAAHPIGSLGIRNTILPSFLNEAHRLRHFTPPFCFSAFFSPEDTLLCVCASDSAVEQFPIDRVRIAELTTGSGLVGLHALGVDRKADLIGLDVDPAAVDIASQNSKHLGVSNRARFQCADLWSESTVQVLRDYEPNLLICNPPYVPEPPGEALKLEAGAGPDGTAHIVRTLELAGFVRPRALSLSWCSLSDPEKVMAHAAAAGYELDALFIVAIADGEYSGSVRSYLQTLPHAYINEQEATVAAVAPDGSASFSYLLMAGSFTRRDANDPDTPQIVEGICERFAEDGIPSLANIHAPFPVAAWILDRWDELTLRAMLHGDISKPSVSK